MPRVIRPIDVESAVRRRRSKLQLAACVLALTSGCGSEKARLGSMKVVDPTVQKQPRLTHEDIPGGYRLGPYDILAPKVREFAIDQTMPIDGVAAYPAYRYDLELTLFVPAKQRTHDVVCVGRRQANLDNTFAAVATEQKDNVLIECDIRSARSRWAFVAGGRLDDNIGGDLVQEGARADAAPVKVEIILWSTRAKYFNRDLAYPVLQVRRGNQVIAAMIVGDREWAWVQPDAPAELREVSMATLAAVRHLPLGFEQ